MGFSEQWRSNVCEKQKTELRMVKAEFRSQKLAWTGLYSAFCIPYSPSFSEVKRKLRGDGLEQRSGR